MTQPDPDQAADALVDALHDRLHSDEHTATPADVLNTIDALQERLYVARDKAVREHRRRTNLAMARSGQLLGHVDPEVVR